MEANRVPATDPNERMMNLEMAVAHLEHELEQMHAVLLAVQNELRSAKDHVSKLERRLILVQQAEENRDPVDERPPHY